MTTADDPMTNAKRWEILEEVEWVTGDIRETASHLAALRHARLIVYREGIRRGVSLRRLGEAAGCSGEAVSAALKRAEARRA